MGTSGFEAYSLGCFPFHDSFKIKRKGFCRPLLTMRNNQDGFHFSTGLLRLPQSLHFAMASCFRYVEPQTNRGQRKLKINTKVRNGRRRDRQGSKRTGEKKRQKKKDKLQQIIKEHLKCKSLLRNRQGRQPKQGMA